MNRDFKKLFGLSPEEIKPFVVLTPLGEAGLFARPAPARAAQGDYFRAADCGAFTVIGTHYSLLVGDCALHLSATACRELYLFGCCGAVNAEVGTAFLARKSWSYESFTDMLSGAPPRACFEPDASLRAELEAALGKGVEPGICASVASLELEKGRIEEFSRMGVNCLEMESAQVFAAAAKTGLKAAGLFYASNRLPDKPWHEQLSPSDIARLSSARKKLAAGLAAFITARAGQAKTAGLGAA